MYNYYADATLEVNSTSPTTPPDSIGLIIGLTILVLSVAAIIAFVAYIYCKKGIIIVATWVGHFKGYD